VLLGVVGIVVVDVVVGGIVVVVVLSDTKIGAAFEVFPKLLLPTDNLLMVLPPNFILYIIYTLSCSSKCS
jgi:hypothetical protein